MDNGRSLREEVKGLTNHSGSRRYVDIPVYLKGRDGEGNGIGRRQCTDNYKIRPVRRKVRELLGLRRGLALDKTPYLHARRLPLAQAVALDEAHLGDDGQADGFGNECEGRCGI